MNQNERRYFSGNTLEQALTQAASHFGVRPDELAYKQLEKKHGFLGKRRGIIIEVDPESPVLAAGEAPETASETPEERPGAATGVMPQKVEPAREAAEIDDVDIHEEVEPEVEVEPKKESDRRESEHERADRSRAVVLDDELVEAAGYAVGEVVEVAGLDLEFEVSPGDGRLEIELWGDDKDALIDDRGSLLMAIQHLMPRLIRGLCGRSAPCRVDADNFHTNHESELQDLALRVAGEVRSSVEPRTLHPMNPAERRIIHVTLADDDDIDTESQGKGFFKRVTIRPVRRRPRGFDRYS
jgi:spoIIIJ-associated protein